MPDPIKINSLPALLATLKRDPLRALDRCRDRYQTSNKSHNDAIYDTIAFIVEFTVELRQPEAEEARREFLNDEYWDGKPHRPKDKDLSRLATMYVLGAKKSHGALYDQALVYTKVVDHFLQFDLNPEEVVAALKKTGIYKLLDQFNPPNPKGGNNHVPQKVEDDDPGEDDGGAPAAAKANPDRDMVVGPKLPEVDLFDMNDDDGENEVEERRADPARPGSDQNPKRTSWRDRFDPEDDLVIKGGLYFRYVWDLGNDETVWVEVQAISPLEDWKQFKIVNARRSDLR